MKLPVFPVQRPYLNQLVRVMHRQWVQQNPMDKTEDRQIGAHTDRQCQHSHHSKAGALDELANGEADVV